LERALGREGCEDLGDGDEVAFSGLRLGRACLGLPTDLRDLLSDLDDAGVEVRILPPRAR